MYRIFIPWTKDVELPTRTHKENLEERDIQRQNERLDMGKHPGID